MSLCLLVPSILQSNGTMDTRSKPTFVLLGHPLLFDNMFVCPFICLACFVCSHLAFFVSMFLACSPCLLCFFLCLSASLFPYLLHVHVWSEGRTSQARAKWAKIHARRCKPRMGNVQQIRGLASLSGYVLLSPSFILFSRACIKVPLHDPIYFSCSLHQSHSLGMAMFVLYFLYLARMALGTLAMSNLLPRFVWLHCA